jgi:hypothetical protein
MTTDTPSPDLAPGGDAKFTVVFEGSLAAFNGNPFKTDTPFGRPYAVGYGDAFERLDKLLASAAETAPDAGLVEALRQCADVLELIVECDAFTEPFAPTHKRDPDDEEARLERINSLFNMARAALSRAGERHD